MALMHIVPGLDEVASEKAIAVLQNRLSHEQEAALVLKHAHDPQVAEVLAQADETAERIATLGGSPLGRADDIVASRTWKRFSLSGRKSTKEYLQALIEYYNDMIADDRNAIAQLDNLDIVSSNIIQDHVQQLEKFQWFMRSHLE